MFLTNPIPFLILSAKSGIINTNPTDANATYYIGYVTADAYTKDFGGDDQTLLNNAVGTINTNLAMGGTFDAVAKKGAMRSLMSGLTPNTAYYAIAFGIKKHKANTVYNTTPLQKLAFTTPGFEVTDNCTFGIATENIQAMLFDVKVTPSNADTRYYVAIKADSETAGKTAEQIADEQIVFEDGFKHQLGNVETNPHRHTDPQQPHRHRRHQPEAGNRLHHLRFRYGHQGLPHNSRIDSESAHIGSQEIRHDNQL